MKTLIFLFMLVPILTFGQNLQFPNGKDVPNVTGMIGIPFGKTKSECILAMKAKGYAATSTKEYLTFKNVKYGKYKAISVAFYFYKGKFFHGMIILIPSIMPKAFEEYEDLVSTINEKYDESISTRDFKTPYSMGDGYEVSAIEGGYTDISDVWNNKGAGTIMSKIQESLLMTIDYYHVNMANQALKEEKSEKPFGPVAISPNQDK